jgi:hypothetical protein
MSVKDLDEDLLLEICRHLLVIDPNRGVWTPSHLSVIEYFEEHHWSQEDANCLVASVCLLLLNDLNFYDLEDDDLEDDGKNRVYGFKGYAGRFWMIHVQNCEKLYNVRLSNLLKQFLGSPTDSSPAYRSWYSIVQGLPFRYRNDSKNLEPVHFTSFAICKYGFYNHLSCWWDTPWLHHAQINGEGRSLLQLAAIAKSVPICRHLIESGADVNAQLQGDYGSALAAAASNGNKEVVELLLKHGAEVNAQLQVGEYGSALAAAAAANNVKTEELLLQHGARAP